MAETDVRKETLEALKNDPRAIELLMMIFGLSEDDAREVWQEKALGTLEKLSRIAEISEEPK